MDVKFIKAMNLTIGIIALWLCGCMDRDHETEKQKNAEPKSTYGRIVKDAHGIETPSAAQQSAIEQADELLKDE